MTATAGGELIDSDTVSAATSMTRADVAGIVGAIVAAAAAALGFLKRYSKTRVDLTNDQAEVYGVQMLRQDNKELREERRLREEYIKAIELELRTLRQQMSDLQHDWDRAQTDLQAAMDHIDRIEARVGQKRGDSTG